MPAKKKTKKTKKKKGDTLKPADLEKTLIKIVVGVIGGAKLDAAECIALVKHIQHQDEIIKAARERLGLE